MWIQSFIGGGRNQELVGLKNGAQSAERFWSHPLFGAYKRSILGVSLQPRMRPFIGCSLNLNEPANLIRLDLSSFRGIV